MAQGTILVVDDDADIVQAVTTRLRSAGYETMSACDGRKATLLAFNTAPDLVILDIGMPNDDGHTVARQLLGSDETKATPIIFLTARVAEEDRVKAYQAGATWYITKPFKSENLLDVVSKALSCSRREPDRSRPGGESERIRASAE